MKKPIVILTLAGILSTSTMVPISSFAENIEEGTAVIYVSPDGRDSAVGTRDNPLQTLDGARRRVRGYSKNKPVEVIFREGTYRMTEGVSFTGADSGLNGNYVTYRAAEGENVVFTGSKKIDVNKLKPVTDPEVLAKIPSEARGSVAEVSLSEHGIELPEITYNDSAAVDNFPMLTLDRQDQMLSQWPNGDTNYTQWEEIISAGGTSNAKGGGIIKYAGTRAENWTEAKDAVLGGYPSVDFRFCFVPIASVNTEDKTITLACGTTAGFKNAESKRYKVFNLLEELDRPGEWYVDRDEQILYYYPPRNLSGAELELTVLNESFMTFDETQYVRFSGIDFEHNMADAVTIGKDTVAVEFSACKFKNLSRNGIVTTGDYGATIESRKADYVNAPSEIKISDCCFEHIGATAVELFSGERRELRAGNSVIQNNYFYDTPCITVNCDTVKFRGVENKFDHNTIHNTRFHAVGFKLSNDSEISNNELYNIGRECFDAAVLYNGRTFLSGGTKIYNNYIHDWLKKDPLIGYDIVGIFLDDMCSGIEIYNNLFVNGEAGIQIGGGHNNIATGNIFGNIRSKPFNTDNRGEAWVVDWSEVTTPISLMWDNNKFMNHYPWVRTAMENFNAPADNVVTGNIADKEIVIHERIEELGDVGNNLTVDASSFVDAENGDYRLRADSEAAALVPDAPNENNFDLTEKGVQQNGITRMERPSEETSVFRKLYPENGAKNVDPLRAELMWEKAPYADEYILTVAKDPEMRDVVLTKRCDFNYCTLDELEAGNTSYYWTVEAVNISANYKAEWKCADVPFLFTTTKYEVLDYTELKNEITAAEEYYAGMTEGDAKGQYPEGTKQDLKNAIDTATLWSWRGAGAATQAELDEQAKVLKSAKTVAQSKQIIGYSGIDMLFDESGRVPGAGAELSVEDDTIVIKKNMDATGLMNVSSAEIIPKIDIMCYKMKFEWGVDTAWLGMALRQEDITASAWSSCGYLICVKKDVIEFQSFPGKIFVEYPNTYIKDGEWVDIQYGALPTADGTRVIFIVDGVTVVDYTDESSNAVTTDGQMAIGFYNGNDKTVLSLKNADSLPEGGLTQTEPEKREYVGFGKLLSDSESWQKTGGSLKLDGDTLSFKGKDKTLYYTSGLKNSEGVDMNIKFNYGDSYQAVSLRNSDPTKEMTEADNYIMKVSRDTITLERYYSGNYELLAVADNKYIPDGETVNMRLAAVLNGSYVQLTLTVDGTNVFNFVDMNAMRTTGALAFSDVSGGGFEISAASGDTAIEDVAVADKSDIYWAADTAELTGEWRDSDSVGANSSAAKQTTDPAAKQTFVSTMQGSTYDFYYWSTVSEDGDENVTVTVEASGDTGARSTVINQRRGVSGWKYLGTYTPSDGRAFVTVTGSGEGTFTAGAVKLVSQSRERYEFAKIFEQVKNPVIIKTGSARAYIGKEEQRPEQAPMIVNNKTLVPLRFVSEAFGAEVSWDAFSSAATVSKDGKTLVFTLNSASYTSNGELRTTEQAATIRNNRLLVPLRVISEELRKQLFWDDRGLIILYDEGKIDATKDIDMIEGIIANMTMEE